MNSIVIDFEKQGGLVPAVVQDSATLDVLMVGFMNRDAFALTQRTGYVHFWSRTRQSLWMKGETSGNQLKVRAAYGDCDSDTLLFMVSVAGDGVCCHTGERTCFFEALTPEPRAGILDSKEQE